VRFGTFRTGKDSGRGLAQSEALRFAATPIHAISRESQNYVLRRPALFFTLGFFQSASVTAGASLIFEVGDFP
jgi:hypothetical protein